MANTFIRFQLQKQRINKQGFAPIKIVYELKGKKDRKALLTDKRIRPENWKDGKAYYLNKKEAAKLSIDIKTLPLQKDIDLLNSELFTIETELRSIEKNLIFENKTFTIADVLTIYKARQGKQPQIIPSKPKVFIIDFIDNYIERNTDIVSKGTLLTYAALSKQLKAYQDETKEKLTFANLDYIKLENLMKYYVKKEYNNSTTSKHFSNLKKMLRIAIKENKELEVKQDFRDYNPKMLSRTNSEPDVIVLEENEFNAILGLDLTDSNKSINLTVKEQGKEVIVPVSYRTLDKVKDLFIFSCTMGLRYSDLMDLKREHIQGNWIKKKQVKGGKVTDLEIPLNDFSSYILGKYESNLTPLPHMTNQKANTYLKLIGELAGIDKKVERNKKVGAGIVSEIQPKYELMSMHMGRRVFVSLSLEKGAGTQSVMSLTGHKKEASFKRYVSISKPQKEKTMSVWNNADKLKIAK